MRNLFRPIEVFYAFLYVVVPAYVVFHILGSPLIGTDDANIYLQYTRNFTGGYGIVYNPGGEHVEGFSSTLYFLICSFFNLFTNTPEICILVFNLLMAVLSCLLILTTIRKICEKVNIIGLNIHLLYFVYLFWMFINPSFFCWSIVTLMDSGLYTFLLVAGYGFFVDLILKEKILNRQKNVSLLVFLMILARPEGLIWSVLYLILDLIMVYNITHNFSQSIKAILRPAIVFIVTLSSLTLYRLLYFGYPLPNTYYTKVSASFSSTLKDGFEYFSGFVSMYNFTILIIVLVLSFWFIREFFKGLRSELYFIVLVTLTFIFAGMLLPVIEGGDHFKAFRFFQPVYPFLIIAFILLLIIFKRASKFLELLLHSLPVMLFLFLVTNAGWANFIRNNNVYQAPVDYKLCIKMEFNIAAYTRENGRRLNEFFRGDLPVIGFGAAGGIAIGYDGIVYDMLGLNLPELAHADAIKTGPKAHQSFNKKIFYKLAPDILMPTAELRNVPISLANVNAYYCDVNSWDNRIYKNIFNDKEFHEKYTLALASNTKHPEYVCYGYFKNEYLKKLSASPDFKFQILN